MQTSRDTPADRASRTATRARLAAPPPDGIELRRAGLEIDVARLDIRCTSGNGEAEGRPRVSVAVDSLTRMVVGASVTPAEPDHRTLGDLAAREAGHALGRMPAPAVSGASKGEGI